MHIIRGLRIDRILEKYRLGELPSYSAKYRITKIVENDPNIIYKLISDMRNGYYEKKRRLIIAILVELKATEALPDLFDILNTESKTLHAEIFWAIKEFSKISKLDKIDKEKAFENIRWDEFVNPSSSRPNYRGVIHEYCIYNPDKKLVLKLWDMLINKSHNERLRKQILEILKNIDPTISDIILPLVLEYYHENLYSSNSSETYKYDLLELIGKMGQESELLLLLKEYDLLREDSSDDYDTDLEFEINFFFKENQKMYNAFNEISSRLGYKSAFDILLQYENKKSQKVIADKKQEHTRIELKRLKTLENIRNAYPDGIDLDLMAEFLDINDAFQLQKWIVHNSSNLNVEIRDYKVHFLNNNSQETKYSTCFNCGQQIIISAANCPHCKKSIIKCVICEFPISFDSEVGICPECESPSHLAHLQKWVKNKSSCPNCKEKLLIDDILITSNITIK